MSSPGGSNYHLIPMAVVLLLAVAVKLGDLLWILLAVVALGWLAGRQRQ